MKVELMLVLIRPLATLSYATKSTTQGLVLCHLLQPLAPNESSVPASRWVEILHASPVHCRVPSHDNANHDQQYQPPKQLKVLAKTILPKVPRVCVVKSTHAPPAESRSRQHTCIFELRTGSTVSNMNRTVLAEEAGQRLPMSHL